MEKYYKYYVLLLCLMEKIHEALAAAEPGVIESLIVAAARRPWLWGLYVFTVGLPMILFISFMWPDKRFGPPDQPYYYKKSDDVQPDDAERSPLTKPAPVPQDKPKDTGARKRDVHKNLKKSDLELKVQ